MEQKYEDKLIAKVILFLGLTTLAVSVWAEALGIEMVTFIILAITGFTFSRHKTAGSQINITSRYSRRCIWKY